MSRNISENVPEEFQEAVKDYFSVLAESYYCRIGEEPDKAPLVEKIVAIFKKVSQEKKIYCLYFMLKSMTKPTGEENLNRWRCEMGNNLTERLEKNI